MVAGEAGGADDAGPTGAASLLPGLGGGVELVSRTSLRPPFWLPGSLGSALGDQPVTGKVSGTVGAWLTVGADLSVIFDTPVPERYDRALGLLGLQAWMLSPEAGHA